jgi:glycosyltransferase involved in cell wall biosynthesis
LRENYDFKLLVIGTSNFAIEGLNVETLPWNEASEVQDLRRIDVGLYPLPNEEWVLGKSGLKALQYMALGIPTVATAIGANFRIIDNGVSGYLVNSDDEWLTILSSLLSNFELRKQIGKKGRERVVESYSISANKSVYLEIFHKVFY